MNTDWHELVSQPKYKVKLQKDVFIKMRDGVHVAADIYSPDVAGKYPALLGFSPYCKDAQNLPVPARTSDPLFGNGGIECGISEYFVSRGYVHVIADTRGTGLSEGAYGVFSKKEQEDGYDVVEWIAKQPWCNGNVGMLGMSYFAMIQYLVAALRPPHLKAIMPVDGATDIYRQWGYHGGILDIGFALRWWFTVRAHTVEATDIPDADLGKMVEELKNNEDIRNYPGAYLSLIFPKMDPHTYDLLLHPHDGPFYWERSAYTKLNKINIPTYLLSRWAAWCIHLPGAFSAYREINAPKKLMITIPESGVGFYRPWHENHDIVLRWYDHWLKGIDTGVMDEPPINILVQGTNEWRYENEWPLARTQWTKYYARAGGLLTETLPSWNEIPDSFTNIARLAPGQQPPCLKYMTAVFTQDTEVTGPIALYLYAALSAEDTNWIAEIIDADAEGAEKRVSIGWLKASHRELDERKSQPYQPFQPHTRSIPVEPGRVYQYAIEIRETSYVFKAGHRMELKVKAQDASWEGKEYHFAFFVHLTNTTEVNHTIFHTREYPTHLLLPIIPKT